MAQVFDFQGVIAVKGERYSQKTVGCWRIRGSFTAAEPREQSERQLEMEGRETVEADRQVLV